MFWNRIRKEWNGRTALLLAATVLLSCLPLLIRPEVFPFKDDVDYVLATFEGLRKTILEYGEFPFWNPWWHGGVPLFANPNTSVFSFELFCSLLFGTFYGLRVAVMLYFLLGSFSMYLFLGDFTKNPWGRFYGSVLFMLAGAWSGHLVNGHFVFLGFAWMPLLFYFVRRLGKRSWKPAAAAGLVAGMIVNHDLHYPALFMLTAAGILFLPVLFRHFREGTFWRNVILAGLSALAVGGYRLLVSVSFLTDYPRVMTDRATILPWQFAKAFLIPFQDLYAGAGVFPNTGMSVWGWHELGCYTGFIALFFVLVSLQRKRLFHAALFLTLLLTLDSACRFLPGYWLREVPFFRSCFAFTRWRFLLLLCLSIAVSSGVTMFCRMPKVRRKIPGILIAVSVLFLLANQIWTFSCAVPCKSEKELLNWDVKRPAGSEIVTMMAPADHLFACVKYNLSNPAGYEPVLGYYHHPVFTHVPLGHKHYQGELYGPHAELIRRTPNTFVFETTEACKVRINANTGNYWRSEGMQLFPKHRTFEESGIFRINIPAAGRWTIRALPPQHEAALCLMLSAAAGSILLILGTVLRERRKIRAEGSDPRP